MLTLFATPNIFSGQEYFFAGLWRGKAVGRLEARRQEAHIRPLVSLCLSWRCSA